MKHLVSDIKEHFFHYLTLAFILIFGIIAFIYFRRYPQAQEISIFLTASFYVLWGIVHHYIEGDLHLRIIFEYLAVALLGFVILWSAISRV